MGQNFWLLVVRFESFKKLERNFRNKINRDPKSVTFSQWRSETSNIGTGKKIKICV